MVKLTNFDHLTTEILEFWPCSWLRIAIFDHLTTAILKFLPWSWSKIFDHLTMTPGRRPNGQKIVVILPPPNLKKLFYIPQIISCAFADEISGTQFDKLIIISEFPAFKMASIIT